MSAGIAAINATNVPQKAAFRSLQLTRQTGVVAEVDRKLPNSTPKSALMKRLLAEMNGPPDSAEDGADSKSVPSQELRKEKENESRGGGELRNLGIPDLEDLPAQEARARPREQVEKTDEERRQAIDKWSRDGAAEAVKEFQSRFPAEQFPEERFPLFSSPDMQKLLWDEDADNKLRLLRIKRCRLALVECNARMSAYQMGQAQIAPVLDSSRRLASSLLALEPDPPTRSAIIRHDLAIAQELEKYADVLLESGTGTKQEVAFAAYERIGAEIRLQQEKDRQQEQDSRPER